MASTSNVHPEYINFLLDPTTPLEFKIKISTEELEEPKSFGVVKWMLIAKSKVLRVMLLQSDIKPEKEFTITDLDPTTFRNFLVYMYGHDHTATLAFEEGIRLLNAAEKYDVAELKSRLGSVLTPKVTAKNVLAILNNGPVCETVPDLWSKATDVIQTRTREVLSQPEMLTVRQEIMVHLLQQDSLSVEEIELWRFSLNWAKHQLNFGEAVLPSPEDLRRTLEPLLQYTRLCTIPTLDLSKEVAPTGILTANEFRDICIAVGKNVKPANLDEKLCKEVVKRNQICSSYADHCQVLSTELKLQTNKSSKQSQLYILPDKNWEFSLQSLILPSNKCPFDLAPFHLTYQCEGNVKVSRVTNYSNNTSSEPPMLEMSFDEEVHYDSSLCLSLLQQGHEVVTLKADNKYKVEISFTQNHQIYWGVRSKYTDCGCFRAHCGEILGGYGSHIKQLHYVRHQFI